MAGALQQYLDDPHFEQNRIEYKTNKEAAERLSKSDVNGKKSNAGKYNSPKVFHPRPMFYNLASSTSPSLPTSSEASASTSQQVATSSQQGNTDTIDFFSAIEEHPTTVNPQNPGYDTRLSLSKVINP